MKQTEITALDRFIGRSVPSTISDRLNASLTTKAIAAITRSTDMELTHEQGRFALACTALENTMMLSAMEAFCYAGATR